MRKTILVFLFSLTLYSAEITNISVEQRTDGSGIVDVTYDLIDSEAIYPSFNVSIEMSIDGGEYSSLNLSDLSGDIGENVIPGLGKNIMIQAPSDTYSTNVVVKIIASATVVTGELPFTMISISSIEGVSSYQEETVDYNFQIMQYELTNADLVTFLETYDFTTDENGNRTYSCDEYTEYFNTGNSGDDGESYGCNDPGAMNYNPDAQHDDGSCIYEWEIGCQDDEAFNHSHEAVYNDCSCYTLNENIYWEAQSDEHMQQFGQCNWYTWFQEYGMVNQLYNALWDADSSYDTNLPGSEGIFNTSTLHLNNLCQDDNALNWFGELSEMIYLLENTISNQDGIDVDFWSCVNYSDPDDTSSCIYDCDTDYLDDNGNEDNNNYYGDANISDFETQDISFEGASFVIESGTGEKPALFNYNTCVDGVIVGLLLDYYGLRLPTGGEWTKAARFDNDRCWPWMSENCEDANETFCSAAFQCQSEESFDACQDEVQQSQTDCYNDCVIEQDVCEEECGCTSGSSSTDCSDFHSDENACIDNDDCTWYNNACLSNCYGCMMNPDNQDTCFDAFDQGNPCFDGCPCCADCDMSGGSCDDDCQTQCVLDHNDCSGGCNEFNNSWEVCGGEEMNDCENNYNNCTQSHVWGDCEEIFAGDLEEILETGGTDNYDDYGFLLSIYENKFFNTVEDNFGDGWDQQTLNLSTVGQYPDGLSYFGLYDMIGNAPELVKHQNILWSAGINPFQSNLPSFCSNDNQIFDQSDSNLPHATGLSILSGSYFPLYGLRLARTTQ